MLLLMGKCIRKDNCQVKNALFVNGGLWLVKEINGVPLVEKKKERKDLPFPVNIPFHSMPGEL